MLSPATVAGTDTMVMGGVGQRFAAEATSQAGDKVRGFQDDECRGVSIGRLRAVLLGYHCL